MRTAIATALLLAALLDGQRAASAAPEEKTSADSTCRSAGALKFDGESPPMQRGRGLEVCGKYRRNTCCNDSHARSLRLYVLRRTRDGCEYYFMVTRWTRDDDDRKIREPVVAKFSQECQRFTEEMVCSSCHPLMGTWEMRNVCPRLCDDWYSACKDEFYSYSGSGSLTPCYGNALVCSPLSSIADSGGEFCSKMGFHVGSSDDREGDECFDGSVPKQLGLAEPTEPWQHTLQRLFEEQMENPSEWFIVAIFFSVISLFLGFKALKQLGDPFSVGQLSLEEVRRLQQERYARGELEYQEETDSSSSDEEPGLMEQLIFQRVPRQSSTPAGGSTSADVESEAPAEAQ